jgi:hypothetical protein
VDLMALDQAFAEETTEIATSGLATRPLSGLKCEVTLRDAQASSWSLSSDGFDDDTIFSII